ncbi:hypothetical protein VKT23_006576 [Stygiomarasmius scandens]|uniref:Uncharacterized protein n=1 Tax=Marasmiellus scandens TaxID=2682957 RepID=A0ABR1JP05_9AGAR
MNTSISFRNLTFDDRDGPLNFTDDWAQSFWKSSDGQRGTFTWAGDLNATMTFTIPVLANAFYYYGLKRSKGGLYAICVDCDPEHPQFLEVDAFDPSDKGDSPPVLLFYQIFDDFKFHDIILENRLDYRTKTTSQINVDRFEIQVQGPNPTSSTSPSQSSNTFSPGGTGTPATKSSSSVGVVVGGVFAGLAVGVLATFLYLRRRSIRRQLDVHRWCFSFKTSSPGGSAIPSALSPYGTHHASEPQRNNTTQLDPALVSVAEPPLPGVSPQLGQVEFQGSVAAGSVLRSEDYLSPPEYDEMFAVRRDLTS